MDTQDQILDRPFGDSALNEAFVNQNLAGAGKRLANMLIDMVVYYILAFVYGIAIGLMGELDEYGEMTLGWTLGIYLLYILYYFVMELLFGKTIGKFLTKTRVVMANGQKPNPISVLGRSFARLIPFEAFSFLGSKAVGWHDSLPGTRVINDVKPNA